MSNINFRQLTFFVAWILCMGFVLAFNFTWVGVAILAVLAIILSLSNVFGEKGKWATVPESLRSYLVSSSIMLLAVHVINNYTSFVSDETADYYKFFRSLVFQHMILEFKETWGIAVTLLAIAIVLVFIRERFSEVFLVYGVLKYLFRTTFFSLLFYYATGNVQLIFGYVACALVFVFTDYLRRVYGNLTDNGGKRWFAVLSIILFVLMFFNYDIYVSLATFKAQMLLSVFGKWYTALFLLVVTVVAYVVTQCFLHNYKAEATFDYITYIALASSVLVAFSAGCFYVGYGWIALAIYLVTMCLYLGVAGPRPGKYDAFQKDKKKYLTLPLIAAGFSLCIIDGHFGKLFVALAFVVSVALGALFWNKIRKIPYTGKRNKWMYTALLALLYINTAVRLWTFHLSLYLLVIMAVVCAALIAIIWVANYNPDVYLRNKYLEWFQYAVPALFLALCLVVFAHGGSTVELEMHGAESVTVEAEAHGDDNSVESVTYMWVMDSDTLKSSVDGEKAVDEDEDVEGEDPEDTEAAEDTEETEKSEESEEKEESKGYKDIKSGDELEVRTGLLKIICEDANGIKTTVKRWCYVPEELTTPYQFPEFPVK